MDSGYNHAQDTTTTTAQPAVAPPTASLPPLARLATHSTEQIRSALALLRQLYFPPPSAPLPKKFALPKRAIRRLIHDEGVPDSGYASAEEEDPEDGGAVEERVTQQEEEDESKLDLLRADPFERAYALKWVTGFISRSGSWICAPSCSAAEAEERSSLLDDISALLSAFTGDEGDTEGALTRVFEFPAGVRVELNDAELSREDHTSVGLQSWGSSILLAERMCASPGEFGLEAGVGGSSAPLRILELGAGTGMLSIVTAKLLAAAGCTPEIIATDYHPDVLSNLSLNVSTNFPPSSSSYPISVHALDWQSPPTTAPFTAPFDLIFAADVIYQPEHARWIKQCVARLLRPQGVFWLIIPLRTTGRHEGMHRTVDALFPRASEVGEGEAGVQLAMLIREEVERRASVGRADEGGYRLYKIGWV